MNADPRVENRLPRILTDLGTGATPDYTDSILARTAATRQRPSWMFTTRLLTMTAITSPAAPVRRVPLRTIGIAALLLLALAVGALLTVGNQPRRLPPPYGLAATGVVSYVNDGQIWVAAADGSARRAITTTAGVKGLPLFSRDGTRIAFLTYASVFSLGHASLSVADADGRRSMVIDPDAYFINTPSWSPDGRLLVYGKASATDEEAGRVYVAASDGSSPPRLVGDPNTFAVAPVISPDGTRIAFFRFDPARPESFQLTVMDIDGSHAVGLSRGVFADIGGAGMEHGTPGIAWSPDGTRILFGAGSPDDQDVFVVDAGGVTPERVIATGPQLEYAATWSPSGAQVAFFRGPRFDFPDLYVAAADGSSQRRIATHLSWFTPQWSPDERVIAVVPNPDLNRGEIRLIDLATDEIVPIPIAGTYIDNQPGADTVSFQRLPLP